MAYGFFFSPCCLYIYIYIYQSYIKIYFHDFSNDFHFSWFFFLMVSLKHRNVEDTGLLVLFFPSGAGGCKERGQFTEFTWNGVWTSKCHTKNFSKRSSFHLILPGMSLLLLTSSCFIWWSWYFCHSSVSCIRHAPFNPYTLCQILWHFSNSRLALFSDK